MHRNLLVRIYVKRKKIVWYIVSIYQRQWSCTEKKTNWNKTNAKFKSKLREWIWRFSFHFLFVCIFAPTLYYIKIDCRRAVYNMLLFLFVCLLAFHSYDSFHFLIILAWVKCVFFPSSYIIVTYVMLWILNIVIRFVRGVLLLLLCEDIYSLNVMKAGSFCLLNVHNFTNF